MLFGISLSNIFWDTFPQARETKAKINKWDHVKLKTCAQEEKIMNKMKRVHPEWGKIFASNIYDKGLISKIYNLTTTTTKQSPIKEWAIART